MSSLVQLRRPHAVQPVVEAADEPRHVHLAALGCRVNEAELEQWSQALWRRGHRVVAHPEQAHVIVLNTCAVTLEAARKSRQLARRLHRKNPRARVVMTGCYAELEPETVAALDGVDLVVPNADKDDLVRTIETEIHPSTMPQLSMDPDAPTLPLRGRTRAFVKVQDGCRYRCTYCIVTVARGQETSRPVDLVIDEVQALHRAGYREAVLTGIHLGGYGSDLGTDLRTLVDALVAHTTIPRLRIGSLEPWDLPEGFWDKWAESPRLCRHVHLPLQSGSDATLRRMARRCSTDAYAALVDRARAVLPDLCISTDIIVGFPGESDAEWRQTMRFVAGLGLSHVHVFPYSARAGTAAATMPGAVDSATKRARCNELSVLAKRMTKHNLERFVGTRRPVLFEGTGNPGGPHEPGFRWLGYTDNYLPVAVTLADDRDIDNAILEVDLVASQEQRLVGSIAAD